MKFHLFALQGVSHIELLQLGVIVGPDGELSSDPKDRKVNEALIDARFGPGYTSKIAQIDWDR